MIFLNILKNLQKDKTIQKLSNKKIKYLLMKHLEDKNRVAFLRSKLKYGKVVFQLSYQYYKGIYLINTEYKPTLINQSETSKPHSYESIYDSISLKKDLWSLIILLLFTYIALTYIYAELYNYIYADLLNDPIFLCFKSTINRINSNYFDKILFDVPLNDLIGNRDLCPNSDFLVFLLGCSESEFTKDADFFLNEFNSVLGFKN